MTTIARLAGPGGARSVLAECPPQAAVADPEAESDVGMSADRAADRVGVRHSHQHGRRATHSRREVQPKGRRDRAILAQGARSREGQSVECGLVHCESAILRTLWCWS